MNTAKWTVRKGYGPWIVDGSRVGTPGRMITGGPGDAATSRGLDTATKER